MWTPWDPLRLSWLVRCPHFRGRFVYTRCVQDHKQSAHYSGCPYSRGVCKVGFHCYICCHFLYHYIVYCNNYDKAPDFQVMRDNLRSVYIFYKICSEICCAHFIKCVHTCRYKCRWVFYKFLDCVTQSVDCAIDRKLGTCSWRGGPVVVNKWTWTLYSAIGLCCR